jgi:DNA repair protein RadC
MKHNTITSNSNSNSNSCSIEQKPAQASNEAVVATAGECVKADTSMAYQESPIGRLQERGAAALSTAEVLAIVTGSDKFQDVETLRGKLCEAGSLQELVHGTGGNLSTTDHTRLLAAMELARRCIFEELEQRPSLGNPRDSGDYLRARLRHLPYEVFTVLYLDNRHRVLGVSELFRGTVDGASVHPREVVRDCLQKNACAVIFAHNHPSGVAEPSAADRAITHELRDALQLVGVRVLDHLVIGAGEPVSMAARGLM